VVEVEVVETVAVMAGVVEVGAVEVGIEEVELGAVVTDEGRVDTVDGMEVDVVRVVLTLVVAVDDDVGIVLVVDGPNAR